MSTRGKTTPDSTAGSFTATSHSDVTGGTSNDTMGAAPSAPVTSKNANPAVLPSFRPSGWSDTEIEAYAQRVEKNPDSQFISSIDPEDGTFDVYCKDTGRLHRNDGPARVRTDNTREYFQHGRQVDGDLFEHRLHTGQPLPTANMGRLKMLPGDPGTVTINVGSHNARTNMNRAVGETPSFFNKSMQSGADYHVVTAADWDQLQRERGRWAASLKKVNRLPKAGLGRRSNFE